jgi:hypothetical protein
MVDVHIYHVAIISPEAYHGHRSHIVAGLSMENGGFFWGVICCNGGLMGHINWLIFTHPPVDICRFYISTMNRGLAIPRLLI